MSTRFTTEQVQQQKERFEAFMSSADMVKIGQAYLLMQRKNANDGRYNEYCYMLRLLKQVANVEGSMYHPDTCKEGVRSRSYRDILVHAALVAITDWCGQYQEIRMMLIADMKSVEGTDYTLYQGSKAYTPTHIINHLTRLTSFGQQYVTGYIEAVNRLRKAK